MMKKANTAAINYADAAGNVFVIIMVAVILFGALMFTFTRSARQGGESISDRQAELAAADILDYAQNVERATQTVLRNDVSENDLDFDTTLFLQNDGTPYASGTFGNTGCINAACRIYDPAGGNFLPARLNAAYFVDSARLASGAPAPGNSEAHVLNISGVGTSQPDLVLEIPALQAAVCTKLNKKIGIIGIPTFAIHGEGPLFQGTYTTPVTIGVTETDLTGKTQFCASTDGTNLTNTFFYVLLAR